MPVAADHTALLSNRTSPMTAQGHLLFSVTCALLAHKAYCYQVRKNIGAYVAAMGGIDVLAFTGDIGETSAAVRSLACQGLGYMGIKLDEEKNRNLGKMGDWAIISADDSPVTILVIANDDERLVAWEALRAIERARAGIGFVRAIEDGEDAIGGIDAAVQHALQVGELAQRRHQALQHECRFAGARGSD